MNDDDERYNSNYIVQPLTTPVVDMTTSGSMFVSILLLLTKLTGAKRDPSFSRKIDFDPFSAK